MAQKLNIEKEALEKLVSEGKSVQAIAEELKCSASTIRKYLKQYELEVQQVALIEETVVEEPKKIKIKISELKGIEHVKQMIKNLVNKRNAEHK